MRILGQSACNRASSGAASDDNEVEGLGSCFGKGGGMDHFGKVVSEIGFFGPGDGGIVEEGIADAS